MLRLRLAFCALSLLVACQIPPRPAAHIAVAPPVVAGWARIATTDDVERLAALGPGWTRALAAARAAGVGSRIRAEAALLDPSAALPHPAPTPGAYLCRLVRLGGRPAFADFRAFYCFVGIGADDRLSITKSEGSERPAGYLWDDTDGRRLIFLGSLAPGRGAPVAYGDDRARDAAGIFQRIAPFRYRLVIPARDGSTALDIFEMVPAPRQNEE
jgi:hypothetical protein